MIPSYETGHHAILFVFTLHSANHLISHHFIMNFRLSCFGFHFHYHGHHHRYRIYRRRCLQHRIL